ncbi:unnamed protein product [Prunus brigantina]
MDAYFGYNQILMHDDNKANTFFIIERGTYCYKVIPFGLKNAGVTYQRLVNKIFKEQISKTMEVYVEDMLVKAPKCADHIKNLAEAFSLLRQYRMKYPQGNGQAEASNKVILDCLKKRPQGAERKLVDELPGVQWAYRTTKRRSNGETPFSLTYGTEAIIPPHIIVPSISLEVGNMRLNLDLLEGEREKTIIGVASYQQ